jgi:hypothetical protein
MSSRSIPAVAHRRAVIDASAGPSLTPPIDAQAREGAHLPTRGLARLGVGADRPVVTSSRVDRLTSGLGWLAEALPSAFFSGDGGRTGFDWYSLQRSLDSFGAPAEPVERVQVVTSARMAFARFVECLSLTAVPS